MNYIDKTLASVVLGGMVSLGLLLPGGQAQGGSLEPPASAFDTNGNPRATGSHAASWDKKLDSTNGDANGCNSNRFTCLFGNTAVRDNETGLVWERDPDTGTTSWAGAIFQCTTRFVGGRKDWRLPMREELATLVDVSNIAPALATGHPFLNVRSDVFWSTSTDVNVPSSAWFVFFEFGSESRDDKVRGDNRVWCVRGGQGYNGQDVQEVIEVLP